MKYYSAYYELDTDRVRSIYDILKEFEDADPEYLEDLFDKKVTFDEFMDIVTAPGGQLVPYLTESGDKAIFNC